MLHTKSRIAQRTPVVFNVVSSVGWQKLLVMSIASVVVENMKRKMNNVVPVSVSMKMSDVGGIVIGAGAVTVLVVIIIVVHVLMNTKMAEEEEEEAEEAEAEAEEAAAAAPSILPLRAQRCRSKP
jgi:hypothetical protein